MGDDLLVSRMTSKDGAFKVDWKTKQQDWWDDSVEIYAKFDGTEKYTPSKTSVFKIRVMFFLRKNPYALLG